MKNTKKRALLLFGGRSGEHEVSLRSAASVLKFMDRNIFEPVLVAIEKSGRWVLQPEIPVDRIPASLPIVSGEEVYLAPYPKAGGSALSFASDAKRTLGFDVVFPVMHGTFCEDGTLQGLFELAEVPYVGCGVLASSVGMDKVFAKRAFETAGIPITPYRVATQEMEPGSVVGELGFPCFVKPANSGSSVGVHKVKKRSDLEDALYDAFKYDTVVLIEKALTVREIELAVLELPGTGEIWVSQPGELKVNHEFYSYEAKYLDENGAVPLLPAPITAEQADEAKRIAKAAFQALQCSGMARVDLFLDQATGRFVLNEINTLPGFTSISMYPKMCEYSGISYPTLITRLFETALERHQKRSALVRDFVVPTN